MKKSNFATADKKDTNPAKSFERDCWWFKLINKWMMNDEETIIFEGWYSNSQHGMVIVLFAWEVRCYGC
ncbi:MAG: hypothetical protein JGK28_05125 [Microcoleus sp. PH2017_07_MST_O_A]|uniref:hypothetical protein n=1 Tax=Microcoleus sp. PH2017_28_MFU_U_A TaxID=2798838 RepID=UPI001D3169DB|nr:hypothetical protein [Microcoleus sp. PH2017_28_MFU_U_A]MCC3417349.1 hypothetical protein [Microcoleus sp. PH2017_07_MST_O_A]MCC3591323.1 hypothetical protein [Microcoleus sp. PH2017_28_MFU_U_A]